MSVKDQTCKEPHHQEAVEQYRQLFEDAPIAYHELDVQGVIRRVNKAECRMLEYSPEEMLGRHICDFAAPQDAEKCRNSFVFKITGKKQPGPPFVRAYRTKSNREIFIEIYEHLMRNHEGKIIGMRSALIDVTGRVEEEIASRSNQRWLDRVFYALGISVLTLDTKGTVTFVNPSAEELLGWDSNDLIGTSFVEKFPATFSSETEYPAYSLPVILEQPWKGVATFLTAGEEKRDAVVQTSPIFTAKKHCLGVIILWRPWPEAVSQSEQEE
jgi:PAS domain S-box-containing protein